MAVRAGMTDLITRLRGMCDAGTADYQVADVTYWDDEQLQDVLDGHRRDIRREPLMLTSDVVAGSTLEYHDYGFRGENAEGTASGATAWVVEDSTGADVAGTDYEVNPRARMIRFSADTRGTAYYLSYRSYALERAAAEVWEMKAGHAHSRFDLKTDNHDLKRSQIYDHCLERAAYYRRKATGQTRRLVRGDVNPAGWR